MQGRNTIFYNPVVFANPDNFDEAKKQFDQVMQNAPKPNEWPGKNVVVSPKFIFTGKAININDLLEESEQQVVKDPISIKQNKL